jgi:hypothetical protein
MLNGPLARMPRVTAIFLMSSIDFPQSVAAQASKSSWVLCIGTRLSGDWNPGGSCPVVSLVGAEAIAFLLSGEMKAAQRHARG